MQRKYHIGAAKQTLSERYFYNVKDILIKGGIVPAYTPDAVFPSALEKGLKKLHPKKLHLSVYGVNVNTISFSTNGVTFIPIELAGTYTIYYDGIIIIRKSISMGSITEQSGISILSGAALMNRGDSICVQTHEEAFITFGTVDVKVLDTPTIYIYDVLDTPIIYLYDDVTGEGSAATSAVLGKAILGKAILGNTNDNVEGLPKLETPIIQIETIGDAIKLETPIIRIEDTDNVEKLSTPSIQLVDVIYKLSTPIINLTEV